MDLCKRFWAKVDKSGDCWLWCGAVNNGGYGYIRDAYITTLTHRLAYKLTFGDIPAGKLICHTCNNRRCVRPEHLQLGTSADNANHMWACKRGYTTFTGPIKKKPIEERFWDRVVKGNECWVWVGGKTESGHGRFTTVGRTRIMAYRWSYEHFIGPIPTGMCIRHMCDNRACVNPAHLQAGTHNDNIQDMVKRGRCKPGHTPGEKNGQSKLTETQVKEIIELCKSKTHNVTRIAHTYGISRVNVRHIRECHTWKHIPR